MMEGEDECRDSSTLGTNETIVLPDSSDTYKIFSHLINGWATLLWVIVGCVGNIYSIYLINWRIRLQTSVSLHMSVLAGWDVLLLGAVFFYYSMAAIWQELEFYPSYQYMAWTFHPISSITMTASLWMIVIITTERHFSIWRPLAFKIKDTMNRARFICVAVGIAAVIFNIPNFLELKIVHCSVSLNSTMGNLSIGTIQVTQLVPTLMRKSPVYNFVYRVFFMSLFTSITPFFYILFLTVRMILFIRQASAQLDSISSKPSKGVRKKRQSSERLVTKVLLVVTLKFLLCHTLPTYLNVWESSIFLKGGSPREMGLHFVYLVDISNLLVVFNSATNSAIYFLCRKKMRRARNISRLRATVIFAVAVTRLLRKQKEEDSKSKGNHSKKHWASLFRPSQHISNFPPSQLSSNHHSKGIVSALLESRSRQSDEEDDAHFTRKEATCIAETWEAMRELQIAEKVFAMLATESLLIASEFVPYGFFDHNDICLEKNEDEKENCETDSLLQFEKQGSSTPAKQIDMMLEMIVRAAGNPVEEEKVSLELQRIGRSHFSSGLRVRNTTWHTMIQVTTDTVKEVLMKRTKTPRLLAYSLDSQEQCVSDSEVEESWKRVICFIISKMKKGRLLTEINGDGCYDHSLNV